MSGQFQRLRIPLVERLALLDLSERLGLSEEALLQRLIRDAILKYASSQDAPDRPKPEPQPGEVASHE
jgi:hypothetical protein